MTTYSPPIESRPTDELIGIKNSSTDDWQQEAIDQAKAELEKRGVTYQDEQKYFQTQAVETKKAEAELQEQRERNAVESYTLPMMWYLFIFSPFVLFNKWQYNGFSDLKAGNYQLKIRQRRKLLIGGVLAWVIISVLISKISYHTK